MNPRTRYRDRESHGPPGARGEYGASHRKAVRRHAPPLHALLRSGRGALLLHAAEMREAVEYLQPATGHCRCRRSCGSRAELVDGRTPAGESTIERLRGIGAVG